MQWKDFTNCEIDLSANYGGSDKKRGIILDGKRYMLKLSDRILPIFFFKKNMSRSLKRIMRGIDNDGL